MNAASEIQLEHVMDYVLAVNEIGNQRLDLLEDLKDIQIKLADTILSLTNDQDRQTLLITTNNWKLA